jgi:pilus assembly protein CpaB
MNRNVIIVLAGGFLIAVLVALLVQASLGGKKKQEAVAVVREEPKVQIVVAAADIKMGADLKPADMKWQSWPKNGLFPGAFVQKDKEQPADVVKGRVRQALKAGDPITASVLVPAKNPSLAQMLKPGMRAMSIDVKPSSMVAGFVGPGDYVDIILTYKQTIKYNGATSPDIKNYIQSVINHEASETILENVKVLAVDQAPSRAEDAPNAKVGKTVTLEVDRKSAEILAVSKTLGDLSLTLRALGDDHVIGYSYPVVTDERVTNIFDEVKKNVDQMEKTSGQNSNIVRIYNGENVQDMPVSQ